MWNLTCGWWLIASEIEATAAADEVTGVARDAVTKVEAGSNNNNNKFTIKN